MAVAISFPLLPVIWTLTRSLVLTPPMLVTRPVTLVELVTAAVTGWLPDVSVIDAALTAVTLPANCRRSCWPGPGVGIAPPLGAAPPPLLLPGAAVVGDADGLAAAGLLVTSRTAVTTRYPAAAASTAVRISAAR